MIPLLDLMLICGVCYVGVQALSKRGAKKNTSWLVKPAMPPASKGLLPYSTRLYIIRCWNECAPKGGQSVMRYTLEDPASGRRCGYTDTETLLHTLLMELTNAQTASTTPVPASLTPRHVLIH